MSHFTPEKTIYQTPPQGSAPAAYKLGDRTPSPPNLQVSDIKQDPHKNITLLSHLHLSTRVLKLRNNRGYAGVITKYVCYVHGWNSMQILFISIGGFDSHKKLRMY